MEHFKSPFGAIDFAGDRVAENQRFFEDMCERARRHRFFDHPFMTNVDTLEPSREFVTFMLTAIYKLVQPFTGLLCSLGGRAPNLRSRFALMDNIYEELGCGDLNAAHPNLYLQMLASIGVSADAAESMPVPSSIRRINDHLQEMVVGRPFSVGCAVLAAAELIIPACFPAFVSLTKGAFSHVDMQFFDRHGPRDEGHSDDAAMLFAVTADPSEFGTVEAEVKLHLDYRSELFDEWMSALDKSFAPIRISARPPRPLSVRPPAMLQSVAHSP